MTNTTPAPLEQILLRYGDDLYRLALLLAPGDRQAADLIVAAVRRTPLGATLPDETALYSALAAALPPERSDRPPAWMLRPQGRPVDAPVLAALARLPRAQRLAIGLILLREMPAEQAAPAVGLEADQLRRMVRDGLALLAPQILPDLPQEHFDESAVPEECRAARRALELNSPALHNDPALRGHLALCPHCRAAEQSWEQITTRVEEVLRRTLREVVLPQEVFEQAAAPPQPSLLTRARGLLAQTWLRRALVPLAVLALVAVLVLPRGQAGTPTGGAPPAPPAQAEPRALVQRALDGLYTPPPGGTGVWHGRWKIRWDFDNSVYATLNAEAWRDPADGRYRLQLVHEAGGGPYEFVLSPSAQRAWYAVTRLYGDSIYPQLSPRDSTQLDLRLTPEQNRRMLEARLGSGAWGIAADYLRQALQASDLRSWGRQRAENGDTLEVLSFRGTSPLGPPPDAPTAPPEPVTLLLTINLHSGALYEVRELSGPAGSEQVGRTTWQFQSEEWISDPIKANQQFELEQVWGGRSGFVRRDTLPDPSLPLVNPQQLRPLAQALRNQSWPPLPPSAPPDATRALLFTQQSRGSDNTYAAYIGERRSVVIAWIWDEQPSNRGTDDVPVEQIELDGRLATLTPLSGRRYQARIPVVGDSTVAVLRVETHGYTRAELIDLIGSLRPLSLENYQAQAPLFFDPRSAEAEATAALQQALAATPAQQEGAVRHVVSRLFQRQAGQQIPGNNPYQGPPFEGLPEELRFELWGRTSDGTQEIATRTRALDGTEPLERSYLGNGRLWIYNRPLNRLTGYSWDGPASFIPWQQTLIELLDCGNLRLRREADGTTVVSRVTQEWRGPNCQSSQYGWQSTDPLRARAQRGPFVADITEDTLTTRVFLNAEGRFVRSEIRAGQTSVGTLIEAWELERDEWLPVEQVPADVFDPEPPQALINLRYDQPFNQEQPLLEISPEQALERVPTGLWVLPVTGAPDAPVQLQAIEVVSVQPNPRYTYRLEDPFSYALEQGLAVRFTYQFFNTASGQMIGTNAIYQGSDTELGAYLRSSGHWLSAAPTEISVGDRRVEAWALSNLNNEPWLIFTLDGTVVAMEGRSVARAFAAEALQPLAATVTP
ncbi:MAG: hypothetical protein OHK0022_25680 [Roseiflexaceae bacterium]